MKIVIFPAPYISHASCVSVKIIKIVIPVFKVLKFMFKWPDWKKPEIHKILIRTIFK